MNVLIDGYGELTASPLDTLRFVASVKGYDEVDVEPWADKVTITAKKNGADDVVRSGATEEEAVRRILTVMAC